MCLPAQVESRSNLGIGDIDLQKGLLHNSVS